MGGLGNQVEVGDETNGSDCNGGGEVLSEVGVLNGEDVDGEFKSDVVGSGCIGGGGVPPIGGLVGGLLGQLGLF